MKTKLLLAMSMLAFHWCACPARAQLPPVIVSQPQSVTVTNGGRAVFSVSVGGSQTLFFHWQYNGTNMVSNGYVLDATADQLTIERATTTNAGAYDVVITNAWGSVTSSVVSLTIVSLPVITRQPVSLVITGLNQAVTFGVGATGTGPFTYQWLLNGKFLPNNLITTVAGNPNSRYAGDGGLATNAGLDEPAGVTADADGNFLVADTFDYRVRKVNASGIITTLAGNGTLGSKGNGSVATNASLYLPAGVAVDANDNLFIADTGNQRVCVVTYGFLITVAGSGQASYSGDGGYAYNAALNRPAGVAVDMDGNIYIADTYNSRIRRVDVNDVITTVAGNGTNGYTGDGGAATNASLYYPAGIIVDAQGNLLIADTYNNRIRKVAANGVISTVAGGRATGYYGDGGAATNAYLSHPSGLTLDILGNLFIADTYNNRIRKVNPQGVISTVAGTGITGFAGDGGPAPNAWLDDPAGVAVDVAGNLLIADTFNSRVRKVTPQGPQYPVADVTLTNAGNYQVIVSSPFGSATSQVAMLTVDLVPRIIQQPAGQIVVSGSNAVLSVMVSGTTPLAYQWQFNGTNLPARGILPGTTASLAFTPVVPNEAGLYDVIITNSLGSVTSSIVTLTVVLPPAINRQPVSQNIISGQSATFTAGVSGSGPLTFQWLLNGTNLPNLPNGLMTTLAGNGTNGYSGDGGGATHAGLYDPYGVAVDAGGNVFIADLNNQRIRKVDASGVITTVAGNGAHGYSGDGGAATNASLFNPSGIAVDASNNLFIADATSERIRKVDGNGIITTVAGNGVFGYAGDGGAATNASLGSPSGVAVDGAGNLYIADRFNGCVRLVNANGIITTVAGRGTNGYAGDDGPATNALLSHPFGVAVDASGDLFIADSGNQRIRMVNGKGIISTLAGTGTNGFAGDGGMATSADLNNPLGVAVDAYGDVFIADEANQRLREVSAGGIISTMAGNGTNGFSGDGGPAVNATLALPTGVAVSPAGNVFIADSLNNRVREILFQGPSLTLTNLTAANDGNYQEVVSSAWGSVTSSVATLTVGSPQISSVAGTNGSVTLNLLTPPNTSSRILAATNLNPPVVWLPVATNVPGASGAWQFTDTNAGPYSTRFYRSITP